MNTRLIIDINHIWVPVWETSVKDFVGDVEQARSTAPAGAMRMLNNFIDGVVANHPIDFPILIAMDSPPYRRKDMFPAYKANRPERPAEYREAQTEFFGALALDSRFTIVSSEGYEADDVIATLAIEKIPEEVHVLVATRDKDLFQIVSERISIISTQTGFVMGPAEVTKKMGVPPEGIIAMLSLMGDSSDGIPGVPGIGEKTAAKLVTEFGPDVVDVLGACHDGTLTPAKWIPVILDRHEDLLMAEALIELNADVPLKRSSSAPVKPAPKAIVPVPPAAPARSVELVSDSMPKRDLVASSPTGQPSSLGLLTLENIKTLGALSAQLFKSGHFKRFGNPEGVFSVMVHGLELGFQPIASLGYFHIVEGRVCPGAHVLIALAARDPQCAFFECVEETDTYSKYRVEKRNGFTAEFRYSLEDAKRDNAKWLKNGGANQRAMLRKTAGSQAARLWFPAATHGLYSAEEMGQQVSEEA